MEIDIKTISTPDMGSLSFFEGMRDVPFEIKRVYYIHDTPEGVEPGGYAHRDLSQLLVCTYGAIEIVLDNGSERRSYTLDDPTKGLLVKGLVWRDMRWLKEGSVLMVAASAFYGESDYIRDRATFDEETKLLKDHGERVMDLREGMCGSKDVVIDAGRDIPFDVERIYYTHNVPVGVSRGGHAHRALSQLLMCPNGVVEVMLDDGQAKESVILDDPAKGLLVGPMVWHDMKWMAEGSVLAVLASSYYDEADYIRDYEAFEREVAMKG